MLAPQFLLPIARELVVDLFAGGGGASTGVEQGIGRHVDIAVNHDPEAISLHERNHPQTRHFCSDVFEVDPITVTDGQPVGLMWASPDCKHFSKAKGGKPVSKRVRGLAWVVIRWAKTVRPRVICLENVEEFKDWGPLDANNMPDAAKKGRTFKRWLSSLVNLGYKVEHRELRAADYGAPTIRKRLFVIARCDGQPVVWPKPSHAKVKAKGLKPWRTAAECIDWSIACPSIFERKKPLAEATLRRIAHGIRRYVIDNPSPFIVPVTHTSSVRSNPTDEPLRTVTTARGGEFALITPTLVQTGYGERPGQAPRVPGLDKPLGTCVDGAKHALVSAVLVKHYAGEPKDERTARAPDGPMQTVTTRDQGSIAAATLIKLHGTSAANDIEEPLGTVTAGGLHHAAVYAFLVKYFGTDQDPRMDEPMHTCTTKARFALVTIHGEEYAIADIGLRMLKPRELFNAQGFPASYEIDRGADGSPLTQEAQIRMCGNSVCPPLAKALVAANYVEQAVIEHRRAA
jgi:DNA (cytosine-5)-methyltransferase 1